mmetsp:Transcript_2877/g.8793  ORF Transcript_2877/g.8793 Transcript_2877/m.8793 type:complete len:202 (-) Transcript_2877:229-834(-)
MSLTVVAACSPENLCATAPRGDRLVAPMVSLASLLSTFTTTPSTSMGSLSRRRAISLANSRISFEVLHVLHCELTMKPISFSFLRHCDCVFGKSSGMFFAAGARSYAMKVSRRDLTALESSSFRPPAAALRTLASLENCSLCRFRYLKSSVRMQTSPVTSTSVQPSGSFSGMPWTSLAFLVTSSPTVPSPLVVACSSSPFL